MKRAQPFSAGLILLAILATASSPAHADDQLSLPVGTPRVIDVKQPVSRIVVAAAGIIDVTVADDHDVQITGLKSGTTSLTIFTKGATEGASYKVTVGNPAAATGKIAAAPAKATPISDAPAITQALHNTPDLAQVSAAESGKSLVIYGTTPSVDAHAQAVAVAGAVTDKPVVDQTQVTSNQMVAVDIRFAVVATSTLNEIGFNFQELGNGLEVATSVPSTTNNFSSVLSSSTPLPIANAFNLFINSSKSNILGTLSALNQSGLTQLLAEPTLLVRSGEQASFLAGGEVPIPVPQGGSSAGTVTIEYHKYGVRLSVAPIVLSPNRISLHVAPEVSEIDSGNGITLDSYTVPAFLTRSTDTTIELGDGQSFVIAGLMYSNNSFSESKFPWLGDLPVIGAFFRITKNSRERQELVVIATPHLVHPMQPDQVPSLPGTNVADYNPTATQTLVGTNNLEHEIASHGLMQ